MYLRDVTELYSEVHRLQEYPDGLRDLFGTLNYADRLSFLRMHRDVELIELRIVKDVPELLEKFPELKAP